MAKLPTRSDTSYKEIEKFKDFELTQCIAYEMAIRNPEIQQLLEKRREISVVRNLDKQMDIFDKIQSNEELEAAVRMYIEIEDIDGSHIKEDEHLKEEIVHKSFFNIPLHTLKSGNEAIETYQAKSSQRSQAKRLPAVKEDSLPKGVFDDDGMVTTSHGATIAYDKFFPKFSRPLPSIPATYSKEVELHLNLALPAKELLAYLETIKKNYDKDENIFQSASLLGDMLEIDKDILDIRIKTKARGSNTSYEVPEKKQQEVYADLLFLYDTYREPALKKVSEKIEHYRYNMTDYYAKKVYRYNKGSRTLHSPEQEKKEIDTIAEHISTPNEHTIRKYQNLMQSYIDDFGYKKLLL